MTFASGLYVGVVTHARLRPRRHRLRYRIFMLLLDLDELPALDAALRLFGLDRLRLMAFRGKDHLDGSTRPLKAQVQELLRQAGLSGDGPIRVLCMPRLLGSAFNPLSVYFCHRADGDLDAILYEVNNTFGERHSYLIPATAGEKVEQDAGKTFYVSPFMDMDLRYAFRVRPPGEAVGVSIEARDGEGVVLNAAFQGRRRDLNDAELMKAWLGHPLMSVGALFAIHWEALKIWLKGVRLRPRPAPPAAAVTVVGGSPRRAAG